jgi:hypothetical protein
MQGQCPICERFETLTRHHLIPRTRHHNRKNKRDFDREVVHRTIGICRPCHSQIHAILTEKELERDWNTIALLRSHPEIPRFGEWMSKKPRGFKCITRASGDKGRSRLP